MGPSPRSSLVSELESLTDLSKEMAGRANSRGAMLVWRSQARRLSSVVLKSGKVEDVATSSLSGHGVHAITVDGRTALGSRDDFLPEPALALLDRTIAAAESAPALGVAGQAPSVMDRVVARAIPESV